jgi:hypothetical protein
MNQLHIFMDEIMIKRKFGVDFVIDFLKFVSDTYNKLNENKDEKFISIYCF